jgi:hypothetical protein
MKKKILKSIAALTIILVAGFYGAQKVQAEGWEQIGKEHFDSTEFIGISSKMVFNPQTGEPYLAFYDSANGTKLTVKKFSDGQWQTIGNANFTSKAAAWSSLAFDVQNNELYLAYEDMIVNADPNGGINLPQNLRVMKYSNGAWQYVGSDGIVAGPSSSFLTIAFNPQTDEPYVAYQDNNNGKLTVKKFSNNSWEIVGDANFADSVSFFSFAFNPVTGEPNILYFECGNYKRGVTLKKFSNSSWQLVGEAGFSPGDAFYLELAFNQISGDPYVAFEDETKDKKATVMKFSNGSWEIVGDAGFGLWNAAPGALEINPVNGELYMAFYDSANSYRPKIMKLINGSWQSLTNSELDNNLEGSGAVSFHPSTGELYYVSFIGGSGYQDYVVLKYSENATLPPTGNNDTGFRPNEDGFGFGNYPKKELSWDSFTQFFGKENTIADNGEKIFAADKYYEKEYRLSANKGNCFGFSGASAINFKNLDQVNSGSFAIPKNERYFDVKNLENGSVINNSLGYYQGSQKSNEYAEIARSHKGWTPKQYYAEIKQAIENGDPMQVELHSGYVQNIYSPMGHSLLAYRYEEHLDTASVYVYDSNKKGINDARIDFNLKEDSASYIGVDSDSHIFDWVSTKSGARMETSNIDIYTHKGIVPWNSLSINNILILISVSPTSSSLIQTSDGHNLGIKDGQWVDDIEGAVSLPLIADDAYPDLESFTTDYAVTLDKSYKININNTQDTPDSLDIYGNQSYISVEGIAPSKDNSAIVTLGENGKSVDVETSQKVTNYTTKLDQETGGRSLVFTISDSSLNPGEHALFELVGLDGKMKIQNEGEAKKYTVTLQEVGGASSNIVLRDIEIGSNATQLLSPEDWNDLENEPVALLTDNNSDGKMDSSIIANAVMINNGDEYTNKREVLLHLVPPTSARYMRISGMPLKKTDKMIRWDKFSSDSEWQLTGTGKRTVYVQFKMNDGSVSDVYSDTIIFDPRKPTAGPVIINGGQRIVSDPNVKIKINARDRISGVNKMEVSNTRDFKDASWTTFKNEFSWTLVPLKDARPQIRRVFVRLKDKAGNVSRIFQGLALLK